MIFTYQHFIEKLNSRIKSDDTFYYELLKTVIAYPNRYTGIFRLSNAKTKLVQNVTQSREIKFGDFMEDIVTEYIGEMGYTNLNKSIGTDHDGNALSADQVFIRGNTVYLVEQKIRDDHDSTKKRGQYENFQKKFTFLSENYPRHQVVATMWFIDDSLVKNKKYYLEMAAAEQTDVEINIFYGKDLFSSLFNRMDVWDEIVSYLQRNKQERSEEILTIPDFDTSPEMRQVIQRLKKEEPKVYRKLHSEKPEYVQLRKELFPTGQNLI